MARNQMTCFFLFICLILLSPGLAYSEKSKAAPKGGSSDKDQIEEMMKELDIDFPWDQNKFTIKGIKPNPDQDNEVANNNRGPGADSKITIIKPWKKEIVSFKGFYPGPFQYKHQPSCTDEKYSMRIIRPHSNIDPGIVMNNFDLNIDYKLRIYHPGTKKEMTGYKGSLQHKFQPKGKKYENPVTNPDK